jgi:hypothetical protein
MIESSLEKAFPNSLILNGGVDIVIIAAHLTATLLEFFGFAARVTGQHRLGYLHRSFADIILSDRDLGFKRKESLEGGLRCFRARAGKQPVHKDCSEKDEAEVAVRRLII